MLGFGAVSHPFPGAYSPGAATQSPSAGESFDALRSTLRKRGKLAQTPRRH